MIRLSACLFENSSIGKDNTALSVQDLAIKAGLLHQDSSGIYSLLTLGVALQRRMENRLRAAMDTAGAAEVRLSLLQDMNLWTATGRDADYDGELLSTTTRAGARFALSATAEEHITNVVKAHLNGRAVDQWLYQIGTKWRDEIRCRGGLIRAREFTMLDGYRFAQERQHVLDTHVQVRGTFQAFFASLGLETTVVAADCGAIGGLNSEEFILKSDLGTNGDLELAHAFVLGTRYSAALGLTGSQGRAVEMGCHGIGVSRTMMAWLDAHRDKQGFFGDEKFSVVDTVVVAVNAHKEGVSEMADQVAWTLERPGDTVALDDRDERAGKKLADSELLGARRRIVVSDRALARGWCDGTVRATGEAFEFALDGLMG